MLKVGLTGGLASGKTFVGEALVELGCHLVQADELGHEVLLPGGESYAAVLLEFGPGILGVDGKIDRRRLAAEVFGRKDRLEALNRLVHPPVMRREEEWMAEVRRIDPSSIAVVEAAILIETGSYQRFDRLILVVCDEELQIARAMKRDGTTREEVRARLNRQMPLEEKRKFADYVIDTSGPKTETVARTRVVYESLRSLAK
jgi:dephospho-CoA kinase